jgi:hypothetical protein
MDKQQQRTGLFTLRREITLEHLLDRKGQTTEPFSHLARQAHAQLVQATDDGRGYQAVVEVRLTILVDPDQARVGEHVSHEALRKYLGIRGAERFPQDESGVVFTTQGVGVRQFQKETPDLWKRTK